MQLIVVDTRKNLRRTIPIDRTLTFGSGEGSQVLLSGRGILPRHCRIELTPEGFRVMAFQSNPGVRVNGRQLRLSPLKAGDVVHIGDYQLVLMPDEGEVVPEGVRDTPELRRIRQLPDEYLDEKLERFESRRTWRRRRNRVTGWVIGGVSAICLVGVAVVVAKSGLLAGGDEPVAPPVDVSAAVFHASVLAGDGRFDEATDGLQEASSQAVDPAERERVEQTRVELEKMRVRYQRAGEIIEEALRLDAFGDGPRALAMLERVVRDYADLRGVREAAWKHVERLRKELPEDARNGYDGLLSPRPLKREYISRIDAYLEEENYSKATSLAKALTFANDEEREIVEETQRRVQELTDHAGADYLEFVHQMLEDGRLMVAYNLLEDESIEHFQRTEPWYQLLELADEVEDQIDEKVPANIRPVERRKHAKRRPSGLEKRELKKLSAEQLKAYGREWAVWEQELADAETEAGQPATERLAEADDEAVEPPAPPVLDAAAADLLRAEFDELLKQADEPQHRQRLREIAGQQPALVSGLLEERWTALREEAGELPGMEAFPDILARRKSLEVARESALALIRDAARSSEAAADWKDTRRETAELLDAVRDVFGDEDRGAPEPRLSVTPELERWWARARPIHELIPELTSQAVQEDLAQALCLVPLDVSVITVRTLALEDAERELLQRDLANKTANRSADGAGNAAEREMLTAVNNYRALLGLPRLAHREALWNAADKHLRWMQAYGKVDLYEQDEERRLPRDRAAQEGAENWSGEVCLEASPSARLTFKELVKQPVLHRLVLFDGHSELAVRADGKLWVLVFGGRSAFVENL